MTSNQLEVMRDEMRVNKRQKKASSQSKEQWKYFKHFDIFLRSKMM